MSENNDTKKLVIGLYGEMQLSMLLHDLGWQVHRAYIDEGIDFSISKYWCPKCKKYSNQYIRHKKYNEKNAKCVTNLCEYCKDTPLEIISKYLQVKTSEGIETADPDIRKFSFHPKIRYDMGDDVFYVWIAVFNDKGIDRKCYFYIFNTKDVAKFDNIDLDTYQITDNQKTTLTINRSGAVINKGKFYDYSCFNNDFFMNTDVLE
jgi:hypothetical protein